MTRRTRTPAKPHARKKAEREKAIVAEYDIDKAWAAGIRKKLLAGCHPFQLAAVTDPARRYSWLVGRGGSKTTSFRVRGVIKLTSKARAKVLYFAATRKRAKDLMWGPLKSLLQRLGFVAGVDVVYNETELQCTIVRTGSIYQLAGLEDFAGPEQWPGDPWAGVQFDECGALKPDLLEYTIYEVIGPRVHVIGLGGTPGRDRRKVFYDATRPGSDKHVPFKDRDKYPDAQGYSSHHWTLEDVVKLPKAKQLYPELVRLWAEALIEKAANGWGDDHPIWLREYRAVWAADNTLRVFGEFKPELADGTPWNIWDPFGDKVIEGVMGLRLACAKLREMFPTWNEWRFVCPEDMGGARERNTRSPHRDPTAPVGASDPYACNVYALSPNDPNRQIWHVMTFEKMGMHSKPIAELLIGADQVDVFVKTGQFPDGGAIPYGGVFGVIGWPDAMSFDTDNAHIAELANVYGIKTKKADKKPEYKAGAFELVNGDFRDGRIKVLKNSPLHQQLEQLQWKELDNGRLIEDPAQANHSTDTLVYGRQDIQGLFDAGLVVQDVTTPKPAERQPFNAPRPPEIASTREQDPYTDLLPVEDYADLDWG